MSEYKARVMRLMVVPAGEPMFSEMATDVSITDEAGGEFVTVEQSGRGDTGKIAINPEEWPAIRAAIDRMVGECQL